MVLMPAFLSRVRATLSANLAVSVDGVKNTPPLSSPLCYRHQSGDYNHGEILA